MLKYSFLLSLISFDMGSSRFKVDREAARFGFVV